MPRLLRAAKAAEYLDRSETKFRDEVAAGRWPRPLSDGRWDRLALDRAVDEELERAESGPASDPYMEALRDGEA